MKHLRALFLTLLVATSAALIAQEDNKGPWRVGYYVGSLRTPYSSLTSGLDLQSGTFGGLPLALDIRLQSRGTLLTLNPEAFDLEAAALWTPKRLLFSKQGTAGVDLAAGLGYKLYWRATAATDERSDAGTAYAPFLRAEARTTLVSMGIFDLDIRLRLDGSLFADGFSARASPQLAAGFGPFFVAIDLDAYCLARLWGTGRATPEIGWTWDSFLMLGLRFR